MDFEKAFENYLLAEKKNSRNSLVQFGLGQVYIARKNTAQALESFENVLKSSPNNLDSLKVEQSEKKHEMPLQWVAERESLENP